MKRVCKYCGKEYDTKKGAQRFCEMNPNRNKAKPMKPSIVKILALKLA